jgi:hypothetical protein
MSFAERITRHYGGDWKASAGQGSIPGDGHSRRDRSVSVKEAPDRPDGILVHCHGAGDWRAEIDRFRRDGLLPKFDPKRGKSREFTPAEREQLDREQREAKARRDDEQRARWEVAACLCDALWAATKLRCRPSQIGSILAGRHLDPSDR